MAIYNTARQRGMLPLWKGDVALCKLYVYIVKLHVALSKADSALGCQVEIDGGNRWGE